MKRGLLMGCGVVILLIAGGAYYFFSNLEGIIQANIEKYGSEITQAEVTLDKVELDLTSGKGTLRGFKVGNPQGFQTPSAFQLGAVSIQIDIGTITDDPVIIKEIVIDKPDVTYELSGDGNNIDALRNNVDAYMEKYGLKGDGAKKDDDGGPKLIIENLYIRGGTVNVSATILKGKSMTVPLPDIHLKDIGKKEGGATPGEVADKIMQSIGDGASTAVSSLGIGKTLDSLSKTLGGAAKSVGEGLSSGAEKTGEMIKGLFK